MSRREWAQETGILDIGTGSQHAFSILSPNDKKMVIYMKKNNIQKYPNTPKEIEKQGQISKFISLRLLPLILMYEVLGPFLNSIIPEEPSYNQKPKPISSFRQQSRFNKWRNQIIREPKRKRSMNEQDDLRIEIHPQHIIRMNVFAVSHNSSRDFWKRNCIRVGVL